MNAYEYRCLMERKFNAIMIPVVSIFFGVFLTAIAFFGFGVDPKVSFAVAAAIVFAVGFGAMIWWNVFVLPKVREFEKKGLFC